MPGPYSLHTDRVTGGPAPAADANALAAAINEAASAATPYVLVLRDAAGNARFADPLDAADAATKGWVETQTGLLVPKSLVDAKGDLLVGTANDTLARLPVGANGTVLTADSAEAGGMKWAAAAGGSSLGPVPLGRALPSTGLWYAASAPGNGEANGLDPGKALGAAHFVPFISRTSFTADRIGIGAHSNGDATMAVRLGIYADDGNFWPGARILDAGTIACNAIANTAAITISQALTAGTLYWLVFAYQGTGTGFPNIKAMANLNNNLMNAGLSSQDAISNGSDQWYYIPSGVTGALPSAFPARSTASALNRAPILTLRSA